ncbi:hypothetical protein C8R45DRAFT_619835 [Mycena sanguinolenta]|nr:hypothetical protein C8R45DRAFT_619835 [Mycena sanguinolenta]
MGEYEVESVTQAKVTKRSKRVFWEYFVKWKNYGIEENTWEPMSSFKGSEEIIDSFWSRIDIGGRDIKNMTEFKIGEIFMPRGPPRRKPSQRNLKADDAEPAASGSSGPSKESTRSGKRRRSSPAPTPDEDEKPAKRTRTRVSEAATRPVQEPRTPREPPRRPPAKPTPTRRTTKKRTPSPEIVPDSEDEAEDVAMLVDPEQQPSIETPIQEEAPPFVAPDTTNEAPTEPMQEDGPSAPGHRGRAAKPKEPLVKKADDFTPLDGAISAKARLRKEASDNKEAPVAGPSSSPRKSPRKPGPGRSSAGMVGKNTSSLLTFEKGALKTVKGKFTSRAAEDDTHVNDTVATPAVPPTSDELLKLGGLDSRAAEALEEFDEPEEVASPTDQPPESDPTQESVTLAKNKLFPPGTSVTASISNNVQAVWRRSTIFGPLYDLPLVPHIPFLSVFLRRGLGSDAAAASTPSDSKPFSLKLDTTVIVPLDLTDVHQSLDTIIKDDGPPGKFFKNTDAIKLLDNVRTGGPSARLRMTDDATEEHKAHFARFRSRLDNGDLFTAMAGQVFLGFSSSETPLMQRLNLPPSLASFSDSVFITKLEIENFTAYLEVLETADTSRW